MKRNLENLNKSRNKQFYSCMIKVNSWKLMIFQFFILMLLPSALYSQTINQTIRGKVTDKDSNQPLPGATVVLQNTNPVIGVVTNLDGEYVINNVPIGRQSLSISFIGYHSSEVKNILLQSGKELIVNVEISEKVENLDVVEVKAYSQNGRAMNGSRICTFVLY